MAQLLSRRAQRRRFFETMLTIHLLQHENTPQEEQSDAAGLHRHLH